MAVVGEPRGTIGTKVDAGIGGANWKVTLPFVSMGVSAPFGAYPSGAYIGNPT